MDDRVKLHQARTAFLALQYMETVDKLSEIVDYKIKDVVYVALRCAYGNRAVHYLPADIQERLRRLQPRGHPRLQRPADSNFFYDVTRSEYPKIVFNAAIRKLFFGSGLKDPEYAKLKDLTELLFSLADREAHRDRPQYFRQHGTEIADALKVAPKLCELLNELIEQLLRGAGFEAKKVGQISLEFRFGPASEGYALHAMHESEVEAMMFEILSTLETGAETIPPMDRFAAGFHAPPEHLIALLRMSVEQGLLAETVGRQDFGIELSITEKGKQRLDALRKIRSR